MDGKSVENLSSRWQVGLDPAATIHNNQLTFFQQLRCKGLSRSGCPPDPKGSGLRVGRLRRDRDNATCPSKPRMVLDVMGSLDTPEFEEVPPIITRRPLGNEKAYCYVEPEPRTSVRGSSTWQEYQYFSSRVCMFRPCTRIRDGFGAGRGPGAQVVERERRKNTKAYDRGLKQVVERVARPDFPLPKACRSAGKTTSWRLLARAQRGDRPLARPILGPTPGPPRPPSALPAVKRPA